MPPKHVHVDVRQECVGGPSQDRSHTIERRSERSSVVPRSRHQEHAARSHFAGLDFVDGHIEAGPYAVAEGMGYLPPILQAARAGDVQHSSQHANKDAPAVVDGH
jgi:hypothetical protein